MDPRRGDRRAGARPADDRRSGHGGVAGGTLGITRARTWTTALLALEVGRSRAARAFTPLARRPTIAAATRGLDGVVRPRAARAHPSLHAQPPARRDRAGHAGRLHALPVQVAARRRARPGSPGSTGCARRSRSSTASSCRPARGSAPCCRRGSIATTRRCSTCCAWPARSAGRGCRRPRVLKLGAGRRRSRSSSASTRSCGTRCARPTAAVEAPLSDDARMVLERLRGARRVVLQRSGGRRAASTRIGCGRRSACSSPPAWRSRTASPACAALIAAAQGRPVRRRSAHELRRPLDGAVGARPTSRDPRSGGRTSGAHAAQPLRRRVPPAADARAERGALARAHARLPAARGARRDPRRPLRLRAWRASSSRCPTPCRCCAKCAARRPTGGSSTICTADPLNLTGIVTAGDRRAAGRPQPDGLSRRRAARRSSKARSCGRWRRSSRRDRSS